MIKNVLKEVIEIIPNPFVSVPLNSIPPVLADSDTDIFKDLILEYAPWVLAIILLFIILLYTSAYFSRSIRTFRIKGSEYFDDETLDFINRGGTYLMILAIGMLMVMIGCRSNEWLWENIWGPFSDYVPYIMSIATILFFSTLIIMVIHRIIMNLRDEIRDVEEKILKFRVLGIIDIILKWTINAIVWTVVILIGLAMVGLHELVVDSVTEFFREKLASIVFIIVWIFVIYFISRTLESFLTDIKKRSTTLSPQMVDLGGNIIRYGLWIFTVILIIYTVLTILNLEGIGTFVMIFFAIILILGVAIVLTTPLRNIFSGIVILNLKPFEVGDRIQLEDGSIYDILSINLWFSKIRTPFGEIIEIPNNNLLKGKILNYSRETKLSFSIGLNVDSKIPFKTVERSLRDAADNTWGIEKRPRPRVFALEFQGRTIRYDLVVHTSKVKRLITVKSRLITSIQSKFHEEDIPIYFFIGPGK
jgi:small conductance mechanosensitive channel